MARDLVPGERAPISGEVVLALDRRPDPPLALSLIPLGRDRRWIPAQVPIDSTGREMRPGAAFDERGALTLDLEAMPEEIDRLVLAAFLTTGPGGGMAFRELQRLELSIGDLRFPLSLLDRSDTAVVLVEIYRHADGWRLSANGQGFVQGLAALAGGYGVDPGWAARLVGGPGEPGSLSDGARPRRGGAATGSGVAVASHYVLTNAHVVEDAREIRVAEDGVSSAAEVVFVDPSNDLALLRVVDRLPAAARFRDGVKLHLGEEVVALGFLLHGLLGSGPQASAGNVAALAGIGNNTSVFQFSAPIASGNSGGPILDSAGLVLGLVSSSLNVEHVRAAGSSAENVNFGIKGAIVRSFLDAYGIAAEVSDPGAVVARAVMVRAARASLYRIACAC